MPNKPQGRYRTLGERGQPSTASVEVGSVMLEISDKSIETKAMNRISKLPCKTGYCFVDQENDKRQTP